MRSSRELKTVIFDLDGTLIDSAPGILASFERVLGDAGIPALLPIDVGLIGPPLKQTLTKLTGIERTEELNQLVERFKEVYDENGYLETVAYEGIEDVLKELQARQIRMSIATNKRFFPTLKILKHLGWTDNFGVVGALDMIAPAFPDKAELIRWIVEKEKYMRVSCLYVGDKWEDGEAAAASGVDFAAAGWGYGDWNQFSLPASWKPLTTPDEIKGLFRSVDCGTSNVLNSN